MPVILVTLEAEIRRIAIESQLQANNLPDPILKVPNTHIQREREREREREKKCILSTCSVPIRERERERKEVYTEHLFCPNHTVLEWCATRVPAPWKAVLQILRGGRCAHCW
jgi:hypothetical protein